jgi:hypothetical protein
MLSKILNKNITAHYTLPYPQVMHDNPNVEQPGEVEPVLTSILLGNLVHTDNNFLPNYSNTRTVQAAELEPEPVAQPSRELVARPSREVADLLP